MPDATPLTTAGGVVVLYHRDPVGLSRLLTSLEGQLGKLYVVNDTLY
jgi:hypothetical protein